MLNPGSLQAAIAGLLTEPYAKDPASAAKKLAGAYHKYAVQGQVGGIPRIPTGTEESLLAGPLAAAFAVIPNTSVAVASAVIAGLTAYWAGAAFGAAGTATPAGLVGAPALQTALNGILAKPNTDAVSLAQQLATTLHTATLTLAVISPAGAPVVIT